MNSLRVLKQFFSESRKIFFRFRKVSFPNRRISLRQMLSNCKTISLRIMESIFRKFLTNHGILLFEFWETFFRIQREIVFEFLKQFSLYPSRNSLLFIDKVSSSFRQECLAKFGRNSHKHCAWNSNKTME